MFLRRVSAMRLLGAALALAFVNDAVSAQERPAVTPRDLATLTDIEGLSISPDGRWAAFQERRANVDTNTYATAWYVVPTSGGPARRIADGGQVLLETIAAPRRISGFMYAPAPQWSSDGQWIIFVRQDRGRTQLWRANIDGRREEQLTRTESEISSRALNPGFRLSADGFRLFFETRISQAQLDVALDVEGRTGFLFDDRFAALAAGVRPGAILGTALNLGPGSASGAGTAVNPTGLSVYDFRSRSEHRAAEAEAAKYAALARSPPRPPQAQNMRGSVVSSVGGSLAWVEARDPLLQGARPPRTIVAQPGGVNTPIVCRHAVCTSQSVGAWMWRNDQELLFNAFADDTLSERALYAWRPNEDGEPRLVLRTHGMYDSRLWNCGLANDHLICFFEELTRPRRLVSINLDTGAVDTLYDPNPDWSRFDLGAEPRIVDVRLPSGAHLPSYLVLPPNFEPGQRLPLVFVTYVCNGFLRGGTGDEYPIFPLAAQGFAVLCHNHLSIDRAFEARASRQESMNEQFAPGEPFQRRIQAGLDSAVSQLTNAGIVDPDRIGLTGLSMGAQTVQFALFNMPRLTAAIASGAPSMTVGFMMGTSFARRMARQQYGIQSQFDPRVDAVALERNVGRVTAPFLINAADDELPGHVATFNALQDGERAVEMLVYPDEYHLKWQPVHRLAIYNRNIDWMNYWLRGVESGLSGDSQQYTRWRAMRDNQCRLFGPNGTQRNVEPRRGEQPIQLLVPWYCRPGAADPAAN